MATVYFTSYKGPGFTSEATIPTPDRHTVKDRCAALIRAGGHLGGRSASGVYKGTWEPSYVVDIPTEDSAVAFARAACVLWEQECALVFTPDATPTHVRVTVSAERAPGVLAAIRPDGYTVLPTGEHVFIQEVPDGLAFPDDVPCTVAWGCAVFITA